MKTTKLTSKELDQKFDENEEDILDDFDVVNVIKRVNVDFPLWMVKALDQESKRLGIGRQALIKTWIAAQLDKQAS